MTIVLEGAGLTLERLMRIAREREKVELHPQALERIRACRRMLEEKIQAHEIMYGVNTGIGEFSEIVLNDEQVREFQRYLIYNPADPNNETWRLPSERHVERRGSSRKPAGEARIIDLPAVRTITWNQPWRWLCLGWAKIVRTWPIRCG